MTLIFLEPIFKERIWGGNKLKTDFGYPISSNLTGECWAISAHAQGETLIRGGKFAGMPLSQLWNEHPELFANTKKRPFPLMVKILDANQDLSVQVHPDDKFAQLVENEMGKAECWYILDATRDAQIIYGHTAKTSEEFKQKVAQNQWSQLLISHKVKRGEFFDVPPGTVHALGAGTLVLEVQQSSDMTYRLFDYERTDDHGNLRELHLDKAFAVIKAPHNAKTAPNESRKIGPSAYFTSIANNQYFQTAKVEITGNLELTISAAYLLVSVIDGFASINGVGIKKGDHFIVPNTLRKLSIVGYVTLIVANETPAS